MNDARNVAVIGAGPAGLMAAEVLASAGHAVTIYDRMPSPARKFLMAGRGGLNLTHSEEATRFLGRYGARAASLKPAFDAWPPQALIAWASGLGIETFTGSSGRVFPRTMKASPLLRAWLKRLDGLGVRLALRHDWRGFDEAGALVFDHAGEAITIAADATVLALGGASWPRLGSNGAWTGILAREGVDIAPFEAANCGVIIPWSLHVAKFAGEPLKRIALTIEGQTIRGEAVITAIGLEGGAVYAGASLIRERARQDGSALLTLDLRPDIALGEIAARLARPRGKATVSNFLRKGLALTPACLALLREPGPMPSAAGELAARIKALPLRVAGCAGLERAISSAGGVRFEAVDGHLMLRARPGVFVAGEMLDWEASTGGYLLQATFATAVLAAKGAAEWLVQNVVPA